MKYIKLFILLMIFLSSCQNFLEERPKEVLVLDENYFADISNIESMVNTLYRIGVPSFYGNGSWEGSVMQMDGYISGFFDNEAKGERIDPLRAQQLSFNSENLSEALFSWWSSCYNAISISNAILKYSENYNNPNDIKYKKLIAEAYFFRAFNYFFLVTNFGEVPIISDPYNNLDGILVQRDNIVDVYDFIIKDLNWAYQYGDLAFAPFGENGFRISKGTVGFLMARVYLQMAGFPSLKTENYQKALEVCLEIINSNKYSLIAHGDFGDGSAYNALRLSDDEKEYIYNYEYEDQIENNQLIWRSLPGKIRFPDIKFNRTFNGYQPLKSYLDLFEIERDLRISNKQLFFNSYKYLDISYEFDDYAPYLFFDEKAIFETGRGDNDIKIFRFSEILLIASECIAEIQGVTPECIKYLADVRSRAYYDEERSNIESYLMNLDKESFIKEVWLERYRELALQFVLWNDIRRTRKIPKRLSVASEFSIEFQDIVGFENQWGSIYSEKFLLYPISQIEMERNSLLIQNEGY